MDDRLSRRSLLAGLGVGTTLGPLAAARRAAAAVAIGPQRRDPGSDADWHDVLSAFESGGPVAMNTANLAPASAPARAALEAYTASVDRDPSFQNRAQFAATRELTREQLAHNLGADANEIAITRNTTEGNNFVVQGLELGTGDEVVLSAHNHPSNRAAWRMRAQRRGFEVIEVALDSPPASPQQLFDDLVAASSGRTRLVAFSHVTNLGGCRYPAAQICRWARERGIRVLIDGAQSAGALELDLHAVGCDFFTASSHKWYCGPREAGVLFVREDVGLEMWPSVVGNGSDNAAGAARFETLGQRDDAAVAGFGIAVEMHNQIDPAIVQARVQRLAGLLKEGLASIPGVTLYTPTDPEFSGGVVAFHVEGIEPRAAHEWLYTERGIAGATSGVPGGGLRLSPHVYNSLDQCRAAVAAAEELARGILGSG